MVRLIKSIVFISFIFIVGYIFGIKEVRFVEIASYSMEPTLKAGDRVAVVKKDVLRRHDIVLIDAPTGEAELLTKRVVGLPSEKIEIKKGNVFINGRRINEPYVKERPVYSLEVEIPKGSYFLLGDNRNKSEDSSVWGPVDVSFIRGRVVLRYWPLREFAFLKSFPVFKR